MNGIVDITVGEETHRLRFNVFGCEVIEDYYTERLVKQNPSSKYQSNALILYGGLVGQASFLGEPNPNYSEVMELFSNFSEQDDYREQQVKIDTAYRESKHGQRFIAEVDKLEKELKLALDEFEKKKMNQEKKKKTP